MGFIDSLDPETKSILEGLSSLQQAVILEPLPGEMNYEQRVQDYLEWWEKEKINVGQDKEEGIPSVGRSGDQDAQAVCWGMQRASIPTKGGLLRGKFGGVKRVPQVITIDDRDERFEEWPVQDNNVDVDATGEG